jgi:hypothetical protein
MGAYNAIYNVVKEKSAEVCYDLMKKPAWNQQRN